MDWYNTYEYGYELMDEYHVSFGITFDVGQGDGSNVLDHTLETDTYSIRLQWA